MVTFSSLFAEINSTMGLHDLLPARVSTRIAIVLIAACLLVPTTVRAEEPEIIAQYAGALGSLNARLTPTVRHDLAHRLLLLSSYYQIDPRLLLAIVSTESNWRAGAVSPVGALGYGQLMPATASDLRVQPLEPFENLDGTARYLRRMIVRYASAPPAERVRLAVASYNAGPYAIARFHGIPPYRETRDYVVNVLSLFHRFSTVLDEPSSNAVARLMLAQPPVRPRPAILAARRPITVSLVLQKPTARNSLARAIRLATMSSAPRPRPLAALPTAVPIVRYETSHSVVARLFGLKHRVVESPAGLPTVVR